MYDDRDNLKKMASSDCDRISRNDLILKVTIHSCENFRSSFLLQPSLCMHVIDGKNGEYVKKSDRTRAVVSFYENQRNDVDYIMPVMTQICAVSGEKLSVLNWEEEFILNEQYDIFIRRDSNIILFFEIVDMISVSVTKQIYKKRSHNGMHKLAWAFLKLLGSNGVINIGSRLRLQLYKPCNFQRKKNVTDVYSWWCKNSRIPLEASLLISVEPYAIYSIEPALRSMLPIQQEKGSTSFEKLAGLSKESFIDFTKKSNGISSENEKTEIVWSRKMGEPCKIPMEKTLLLDIVNCCQILKFSCSGKILAAGCGAVDCYYLLLYQIPGGHILHKVLAHSELIYDLDWSNNDQYIISASGDYNVKMWNTICWSLVATFAHPSFVYSAKFHPKMTNLLASACYDHIVRIWEIEKCHVLKELEAHNSSVCSIAWNTSGTKLFSVDGIGQIKVWKKNIQDFGDMFKLEKEVNPPEIKGISINKVLLDSTEETLCLFCSDSIIRIFNLFTENVISSFESDVPSPKFSKGCYSPCGNLLFLCNDKETVSVWDKKSCNEKPHSTLYHLKNGGISCIEYHPHEHMLALSFWEDGVPIHVYTHQKSNQLKKGTVLDISNITMCNQDRVSDEKKKCFIKGNKSIEKFNIGVNSHIENSSEIENQLSFASPTVNIKKTFKIIPHISGGFEDASSGSSDLFLDNIKSGAHKKELLTAVITSTGQFDVIAVPDDSTSSDSNTSKNLGNNPVIPNRSSKRSERRKRLREMHKDALLLK